MKNIKSSSDIFEDTSHVFREINKNKSENKFLIYAKSCSSIFDPCNSKLILGKAGHVTFNAGARTRKMEEGEKKIKHAECYVVKRTCR